ncbi:MAG: type III toxin-antitoxin system ToxN/AbiQ family toxin [Spirochaetaceae bacterium]|nr:type III toxin-antitoxin system ToxN/AbiQ family toxin [Spirochaetaceae bacterium]
MFKLKEKLTFININQDYLKYLHENCSEVYYKKIGYDKKPYLGILINEDNNQYVIPLSSAKEKHKSWKNIDTDRFLIFENCDKSALSRNAIYKENPDGTAKHILSVIDLKKMLPIKDGLYTRVDLIANQQDSVEERNYKNLMNKEFSFCLKILPSIIQKANKIYSKQIETGNIIKFCCDFKLLEKLCRLYKA